MERDGEMNGIKTHRRNKKKVEKDRSVEKSDQIMLISGSLVKYQVAIVMHTHGLTFCFASFSYTSVFLCQYHSAFIVITV